MRISDWSSDVCSSDLLVALALQACGLFGDARIDAAAQLGVLLRESVDVMRQIAADAGKVVGRAHFEPSAAQIAQDQAEGSERAACGADERVDEIGRAHV